MIKLLALLPGSVKIGAVLALLAMLGGAWWWIDHQGYARATARCEARMSAQAAANREAVRLADKRLADLADAQSLKNLEIDDAVDQLVDAAAVRAGGDIVCLDIDSVRGLGALR